MLHFYYQLEFGTTCLLVLNLFISSALGVEISKHQAQDGDIGTDMDFLMNVTRIDKSENLEFGHDSVVHGQDSHDWDKDDRRGDQDYNEEKWQRARDDPVGHILITAGNSDNKSAFDKSLNFLDNRGNGLYNEDGRNELKTYEAEYEASLKKTGESTDVLGKSTIQSGDVDGGNSRAVDDADEYDDGMDLQDDQMEEDDDVRHDETDHSSYTKPHTIDTWESSHVYHNSDKKQDIIEDAEKASHDMYSEETLSNSQHSEAQHHSKHARKLLPGRRSRSRKKSKHRKSLGNYFSSHVIIQYTSG